MNKKYSDKTKEKVIKQYLAGVNVSDLVSKFNVSRTTVYTWTRDHKKKQKHEAVQSSSTVCIITSHSTIGKDLIPSSAIRRRINTRRCTISTIQTAHVWFKRNSKNRVGEI